MTNLISKIFNCNDDTCFEEISLELFNYQMDNNPVYKSYASLLLKNKKPQNIYEIPFLPIELFKQKKVLCKERDAEKIFVSSGTSGNQSSHFIADISLYRTSFQKTFLHFYGAIEDYCVLALLPSYLKHKESSLIYMMDHLIKQSKHQTSGFYINNLEDLASTIKQLEKKKTKKNSFLCNLFHFRFCKKISD